MTITEDTLIRSSPPSDEVDYQQRNSNANEFEDPSLLNKTLTLDPQIHLGDDSQPSEVLEQDEKTEAIIADDQLRTASYRRGKRKRMNKKHFELLQQKVEISKGKLKLIPFVPNKTLDFSSHEVLLRRIGLWDFVHIQLDITDLRVDLIAQLVVNFKRQARVSEVNGVRIKVSRAELGRALKLPAGKKDNSNNMLIIGDEDEEVVNEKSVHFIEELMSNWMLLHNDDDAWMLPEEIATWLEMVRKGHPDKVEWASLMWYMVEKELSQGVDLVDCYYASHLQHLIKHQNARLFLAKSNENVILKEEEADEEDSRDMTMVDDGHQHVDTALDKNCESDDENMIQAASGKCEAEMVSISVSKLDAEETISGELEKCKADMFSISVSKLDTEENISEELVGNSDNPVHDGTHMMELSSHIETDKSDELMDLHNDCLEVNSEELSVELTLGQENTTKIDRAQADDVIDFDGLELGESDHWQLNETIAEEDPLLQQCSFGRNQDSFDIDGNEKDVIMEEDVDDDDDNDDDDDYGDADEEDEDADEEDEKDGQAGEEGGIDLFPKFDSLQGISDAHMFQGIDTSQCAFGSPLPHINESPIQHFTSHAETSSSMFGSTPKIVGTHDQNLSYHTTADGNKRLKREGTWGHQEPSDFNRCMENIEHWMGKAKLIYASKEQECTQMGMNQQLLYDELGRREHMIEQQQKVTHEVRQKSQMEIYKLEQELFIMGGLLDSYRKALKETRQEFSEYRKKCAFPEESLYKDAGPGGLVLSVAELEKQRLKQEEEVKMKRLELESKVKNFEAEWYSVFEGHLIGVQKLDEKLSHVEEKANLLKLIPRKQKAVEVTEHPVTKED